MKRCPECRRDYFDDTLVFCLEDGASLVYGVSEDEPATAVLSEPGAVATGSSASESLTRPQINTTDQTAILGVGEEPGTADPSRSSRSKSRAILGAIILLLVGGIGYGIYRWIVTKEKPPLSFQTAKFMRLTTTGKASGVAISPDGKYVVHVEDDGGQQSLWMRQTLTQSNVQIVVPAAVTYHGSTFSADGTYVFYILSSQEFPLRALFQVPVLGGTAKKVVEDLIASPVTFSPDGKQLAFVRPVPGKEHKLIIANVDGTSERELMVTGNPAGNLVSPTWSPDGKKIAYSLVNAESNDATIYEVSVADGSTRPLTSQRWFRVNRTTWLADGSGLLMLAPPDERFVYQIWQVSYLTGESRQLTNDLNNYVSLSVAANSDSLAIVQSTTQASIWVAPVNDPSGAIPITSGSGKADTYLSWTPDGRITYTSNASGSDDIWIVNSDGAGARQLTSNSRLNQSPEVSPDGRLIVFLSDRGGVPHIWRMNLDGSDQRQLGFGSGGEQGARFSPDGRWLVYRTSVGRWTTWKIPVEGGEPIMITDKTSRSPTVSPDSKLVAYFYREENGPWRIAVAPFEGGEPIKTFDIPAIPDPSLRWTPDGRSVAYIDTKNGVSNIVAQPIDGGPTKPVTDFKTDRIFSFAYSSDGKRIALSRGTISNDVVLISDFK